MLTEILDEFFNLSEFGFPNIYFRMLDITKKYLA